MINIKYINIHYSIQNNIYLILIMFLETEDNLPRYEEQAKIVD